MPAPSSKITIQKYEAPHQYDTEYMRYEEDYQQSLRQGCWRYYERTGIITNRGFEKVFLVDVKQYAGRHAITITETIYEMCLERNIKFAIPESDDERDKVENTPKYHLDHGKMQTYFVTPLLHDSHQYNVDSVPTRGFSL